MQRTASHFKHSGSKTLFFILLGYFIWCFSALNIIQLHDMDLLVAFTRFKFIGVAFICPLWALIFIHVFFKEQIKLTKTLTTIILTPAAVIAITCWLPFTRDYFSYDFEAITIHGITTIKYKDGPIFYFHVIYTYLLLYTGLFFLFIKLVFSKTFKYRSQAIVILISTGFSIIADTYAMTIDENYRWLQLTPVTLLPSALGLSFALFKFEFLDLYLLSRNIAFENTKNPIFVFDKYNTLKNFNTQAKELCHGEIRAGINLDNVFSFLSNEQVAKINGNISITIPHLEHDRCRYFRIEYDLVNKKKDSYQGKIITLLDTTKEKVLTNELEEYIALKNKLLSIISHDVLGNINSLNSLSTQLFEKVDELDKERIKRTLGVMSYSSLVSKDFLFNLLHWIKGQNKTLEIHKEEFCVQDLIERCTKEVGPIGHSREVDIVNKTVNNFKILADPNIMALITRNLLSNAIKHGARNSNVEIEAKQDNGTAIFSISNKGDRVSNAFLNSLFEKEKSKKNRLSPDSIGMGLNLCIDFVEAHEGKIWATPNEDGGSVFKFSIPIQHA